MNNNYKNNNKDNMNHGFNPDEGYDDGDNFNPNNQFNDGQDGYNDQDAEFNDGGVNNDGYNDDYNNDGYNDQYNDGNNDQYNNGNNQYNNDGINNDGYNDDYNDETGQYNDGGYNNGNNINNDQYNDNNNNFEQDPFSGVFPTDSQFLQLTTNVFPNKRKICRQLKYGVVVQPLADVGYDLPTVQFGSCDVIRCDGCSTYINPYCQFIKKGTKWICNLCKKVNSVPDPYYSALDPNTGLRKDINDRVELTNGTFEVLAGEDYIRRQPMPPAFIFIINVCKKSVRSGMLQSAIDTIKLSLQNIPVKSRARVAFLTYDSTIHFYGFGKGKKRAQMHVLPDLEDLYLPQYSDLLIRLSENEDKIDALLDTLPKQFEDTDDVESCLGVALIAAFKIIGFNGGKMMIFSSSLPSIGKGRLMNRGNPELWGKEKENTLFAQGNDYYKELALKFTKKHICCDTFFFDDEYTDIATVGILSKLTGGQSYYYPNFKVSTFGKKFEHDLYGAITKNMGWEALLRLRCSKGLRVQGCYGNFIFYEDDLLALPNLDQEKTYAVRIVVTEEAQFTEYVYFQMALLYSSSAGERRIRISTVRVPTSNSSKDILCSINANVMSNFITRFTLNGVNLRSLNNSRLIVKENCKLVMRMVKKAFGLKKMSQEYYPENLYNFPQLCLGVMKSVIFRGGVDTDPDLRLSVFHLINTMKVFQFELYAQPRLIPIHDLQGDEGTMDEKQNAVILPQELPLTLDSLYSDGIYLIDNGVDILIRVGSQTDPNVLKDLFQETEFKSIIPRIADRILDAKVEEKDNSLLGRTLRIIKFLRDSSQYRQNVQCVKEGSTHEANFTKLLYNDKTTKSESLQDFLRTLNNA